MKTIKTWIHNIESEMRRSTAFLVFILVLLFAAYFVVIIPLILATSLILPEFILAFRIVILIISTAFGCLVTSWALNIRNHK